MTLQRISHRIRLVEAPSGFAAYISAPKNIFMLLFLPFWYAGWTFGGFAAVVAISSGEARARNDFWFLLVWLCFWFAAWVFTAVAWLWMAFGKETISIRDEVLIIRRDIFGFGCAKRILISEISDINVANPPELFSWDWSNQRWGFGGGRVGVETSDKTYKLGFKLKDEEAEILVEKLARVCAGTSNKRLERTAHQQAS